MRRRVNAISQAGILVSMLILLPVSGALGVLGLPFAPTATVLAIVMSLSMIAGADPTLSRQSRSFLRTSVVLTNAIQFSSEVSVGVLLYLLPSLVGI